MDVIQATHHDVYPPSEEWVRVDQNCTEGTAGDDTYDGVQVLVPAENGPK